MIVAILAGIAFAGSNASFLFVVRATFLRIIPEEQRTSFSQTVPGAQTTSIPAWSDAVFRMLDPWLPLRGRDLEARQVFGIIFLLGLVAALRSLFSYLNSYCMTWVSARFITDLRTDLLQKLYSLSLDFYQRSTVGDLTNRVVADTQTLYNSVSTVFADLIKEPATVVGIIVASLFIDWHLTIFACINSARLPGADHHSGQ